MATIGTMALKLVADGGGLAAGLSDAQRRITRFSAAAGNLVSSPLRGAVSIASTPFMAIDALMKPIRAAASSIPIIGEALAGVPLTGASFLQFIKTSADAVAELTGRSRQLGVSTELLAGLTLRSGVEAEKLDSGLRVLGRTLGELQAGSPEVEKKLRILGFDLESMRTKSMDDALVAIAERMHGFQSASERAYLATRLLGEGGAALIPLLSKGAAGLAEAKARAQELGLSFDGLQAAPLLGARRAFKEFEMSIKGVGVQMAIGVGPYLEAASQHLGRMGVSAQRFGEIVSDMTGKLYRFALVSEFAWGWLVPDEYSWTGLMRVATDGPKALWLKFKRELGEDIIGGPFTAEDERELERISQSQVSRATRFATSWAESYQAVDKAKESAKQAAATLADTAEIERLTEELEKLGKAAEHPAAAFNRTMDTMQHALSRGVGSAEEWYEIEEKAYRDLRSAFKVPEDPLTQFNDMLAKLYEIQGITEDVRNELAGGLFADLQKQTKLPQNVLPRALVAGSQEAVSAVLQHELGSQARKPEEYLKELVGVQREQTRILQENGRRLNDQQNLQILSIP